MGDCHGGAQRTPMGSEPVGLVLVVGLLGPSRAYGRDDQRRLEVDVALARACPLALAGALAVA